MSPTPENIPAPAGERLGKLPGASTAIPARGVIQQILAELETDNDEHIASVGTELRWLETAIREDAMLSEGPASFVRGWLEELMDVGSESDDVGLGGRARVAEIATYIHGAAVYPTTSKPQPE